MRQRVQAVELELLELAVSPLGRPIREAAPSFPAIERIRAGRKIVPKVRVLDQPALGDTSCDLLVGEHQLVIDRIEAARLICGAHPLAVWRSELLGRGRELDSMPVLGRTSEREVKDADWEAWRDDQLHVGPR